MLSLTGRTLALTVAALFATAEWVCATSTVDRRDIFVTDVSQCPQLTARDAGAKSVHDLRPDEFDVVMAVGDSITAGALAKGVAPSGNASASLNEWRGVSYPIGGDRGALTLPNIMKRYNPGVQGASVGSHAVEACLPAGVPVCQAHTPSVDRLNGALSGALATDLPHEARDYLVPQVQAMRIPASAFKYLNLQIGSNDICQLCFLNAGRSPTAADIYEARIRETLKILRANIPNTVVGVLGIMPISELYNLTQKDAAPPSNYCPPSVTESVPSVPQVNMIECPCALLPPPLGDVVRAQMEDLRAQYNARLLKIVQDYQRARYPDFAVTYQPLNTPIATYPIQALSNVDCFHPSEGFHARLAAALWNRLPLDAAARAEEIAYPDADTPMIRCAMEGDRIPTAGALGLSL